MIKLPVKKVRYHKKVWTHEVMDDLRKSDCLCLNCARLTNPDPSLDCPIAKQLLSVCQNNHVALAVTRCPIWIPKPSIATLGGKDAIPR